MNNVRETPVVCLYHADCPDGLGAAWAVKQKHPQAQCIPVKYGSPMPTDQLLGKRVYIVDFCYPFDEMYSLAMLVEELHVFDHHSGVANVIYSLEDTFRMLKFDPKKFECVFDNSVSAAKLTWQLLHGTNDVPVIIDHISDSDLFQFRLAGTRAISAALLSYPLDIDEWSSLLVWTPDYKCCDTTHPLNVVVDLFKADGEVLLRKETTDIKRLIALTERQIILTTTAVPLINIPRIYVSQALDLLAEKHPYAVGYFDSNEYREYSLRSKQGTGADVSEIAKLFGGGGHKHAAGFRVPRDHPLAQL